jgi:predicted DNA-binding transcriptional regulator YafY
VGIIVSVGQRSGTETVIQLVQAFMDRRTWSQADLARRLGMTTAAVRGKLVELTSAFQLEREEDHPHVYWSVPRSWFPGGVLFKREQLPELLRLLSRLPKSKSRDAILGHILAHLPGEVAPDAQGAAVVPPRASAHEIEILDALEDAARRRVPLKFRYYTAHRGTMNQRHASIHRVLVAPPARFVATCHRTGELKWFRVENVSDARLDDGEEFRAAKASDVDAFLSASVDGFNAGGALTTMAFVVREPEARWVAMNLPSPMRAEEQRGGGIRVTVETNAVRQVARFVVSLGGAATVETTVLRDEVARIARAALTGCS